MGFEFAGINGRIYCFFFLSLTKTTVVSERIMNNGRIMAEGNSGTTHVPSIVTCSGLSCVYVKYKKVCVSLVFSSKSVIVVLSILIVHVLPVRRIFGIVTLQ